jgi:hypothetical protein
MEIISMNNKFKERIKIRIILILIREYFLLTTSDSEFVPKVTFLFFINLVVSNYMDCGNRN